ncbi:MAG: hypothetical protein WCV84_02085 [Patescibacteria group bacterium]
MQNLFLEPQQLIAMVDYPPLHSPEALRAYYAKHKAGADVEPVVVVPVEIAKRYFMQMHDRYDTYRDALDTFLSDHPAAKYFMFGGKHRSAAATVLGVKIPCLVIQDDADVSEAHAWMDAGKLTGVPSVGETFGDSLRELEEHYFEHKRFWTMQEKTEAMIKNNDIPENMLENRRK